MNDVPTGSEAPSRWHPRRLVGASSWGNWLIVVLAVVPALASRPGRMPSDTKLYLYLDPGRLITDAPLTWDIRQFGGWVPHQVIAYLWPSGPWYWTFDRLGLPDWVAHRLWIAALIAAAGIGVRWAARVLGIAAAGATAAGVVYALSPYLLPYVSRTSSMLLPWAGLGWLVGLTVRAATRSRWRDAGLFALVVFTIGAVNATALALIAPGPVLWLVHAAWERRITWSHALRTALRLGVLSVAVSLWWMVMLVVQGRHGADVLAFSETLADVSRTAVGTEVLRGLGYWLFYVRDPYAATTTASIDYLSGTVVIAAGYALTLLGMLGLAVVRWSQRRFAVLVMAAGALLAVGVHPIEQPSPLMAPLAESGLGLALRSSTRALPLLLLGSALGIGALLTALQQRAVARPHRVLCPLAGAAPALVVLLAVVNLPALPEGRLVDPALERDQEVPAAWRAAAAALDEPSPLGAPSETRVLQIPGSEFGAFRWGYTVDPPLPGIAATPLITRDLLPLGSPGVMDLLYALDNRIQAGVLEPAAVAPVARLLAADTIWLANDLAFDRFRTPRPESFARLFRDPPPGLGAAVAYGTPQANLADVAMLDEQALSDPEIGSPLAPVELLPVEDAVPVLRVADRGIIVVGSGDGLVDAAAAGLIDGDELVWYAADLDRSGATRSVADLGDTPVALVLLTDSNRDRAMHWRSSQDTTGFTESGGPDADLTRPAVGDTRLGVFSAIDADQQTVALLDSGDDDLGRLRVRASAYGEPFAWRPEHRAAMAVDGDPATAWVVGDRADPVGESITVDPWAGDLVLLQSQDPDATRRIDRVRIEHAGGSFEVVLDDRSWSPPGQPVDLPAAAAGAPLRLVVTTVAPRPGGTDTGPSAVGFAELGPVAPEITRLPLLGPTTAARSAASPLAVVLTRERVEATDRWRSDPEPAMRRRFELPTPRDLDIEVTLRLDHRADDTALARLAGRSPVAVASSRLTGVPGASGAAAVDGDASTAWITPFGRAQGETLTLRAVPGSAIEQVTLSQGGGLPGRDDIWSRITGLSFTTAAGQRAVTVPVPDVDGTSAVVLDPPLTVGDDGTVTVAIDTVEARTTIDRRYAEVTVLPARIAELGGIALAETATTDAITLTDSSGEDGECRTDLLTVDGRPVALRVDADDRRALLDGGTVVTEPCERGPLRLDAGPHTVVTGTGRDAATGTAIDVDRVVLRSGDVDSARRSASSQPVAVERTRTTRTAAVPACPAGCWIVFGEGYNPAWEAIARRADGTTVDLGAPQQVSGGFNGWRLDPAAQPQTIEMRWTPQRSLDRALLVATLGVVAALVAVVIGGRVSRRRRLSTASDPAPVESPTFALLPDRVGVRSAWISALALVIGSAVLVRPVMALPALAVAVVIVLTRRPGLAAYGAVVLTAALAMLVLRRVRLYRPAPDATWPMAVADLHAPAVWVVVLLAAAVLAEARHQSR